MRAKTDLSQTMITCKALLKAALLLATFAALMAPIIVRRPNYRSQTNDKNGDADVRAAPRGLLLAKTTVSSRSKQPGSQRTKFSGDPKCMDPICYNYLTAEERARWQRCAQTTALRIRSDNDGPLRMRNGSCRFMNGAGRTTPGPVALASFPGSGNTWIRCLLEKATGICTGAVYCDVTLRGTDYTGEGINGSSVIAVKTHAFHPTFIGHNNKIGSQVFASAILIVRNPRDTIVAEWNRRNNKWKTINSTSSHVLSVGPEMFGHNTAWSTQVPSMIEHWSTQVTSWLTQGKGHPLLTVRYEDIKVDPVGEIGKVLDFLGLPFTMKELSQRLTGSCGGFKRPHSSDFHHYTRQQRDLIQEAIQRTIQRLRETNTKEVELLSEYLDTGRD